MGALASALAGPGTVTHHCGSWRSALAAAGLAEPPRERELGLRERVAAARRLRSGGASLAAIADTLAVDPSTVRGYLRATSCPDCGGPLVTPAPRAVAHAIGAGGAGALGRGLPRRA